MRILLLVFMAFAEASADPDPLTFLEQLRSAAQKESVDENVLFAFALEVMGTAQYHPDLTPREREALLDEAIAALRQILLDKPELTRVRLDLARAFFLKGEDGLARKHFEQALAGDLPAPVVMNVEHFLAMIQRRKNWHATFGVTLMPDRNIGADSEDEVLWIYGLPFLPENDEGPAAGVGLSLWGSAERKTRMSEDWHLRAGMNLSRLEHSAAKHDRMNVEAYLGPQWLMRPSTHMSALATANQNWDGRSDPRYRSLGTRIEGQYALTPRLGARTRFTWNTRNYRKGDLDGAHRHLSAELLWRVRPNISLQGLLSWGRERPATERQRNSSRSISLGGTVELPRGFTVSGRGSVRSTDYEGDWFPFTPGGGRKDRTRTLRLSVYNRAWTFRGFSPQLSVSRELRDSNAQFHDYRRTFAELSFVRQF